MSYVRWNSGFFISNIKEDTGSPSGILRLNILVDHSSDIVPMAAAICTSLMLLVVSAMGKLSLLQMTSFIFSFSSSTELCRGTSAVTGGGTPCEMGLPSEVKSDATILPPYRVNGLFVL